MKFGLPISFTMHAAALFGGLLLWEGENADFPEVKIIDLNLVSVADVTNVKAVRKAPPTETPPTPEQPEPEPPKEVPAEETPRPLVSDGSDTPKTAPLEPSEPKEEPANPRKEEPKKPKEPEEPKLNLDAIANQLRQTRDDNPTAGGAIPLENEIAMAERGDSTQSRAGEGTGSEINSEDYIRQAMSACWQIDEGMKGYEDLKVHLRVNLDVDGRVTGVDVLNNSRIIASGNSSWQAAREKAISGVYECEASFAKLPKDAYEDWKSTELTFDPGANK